MDAQKPSRPPSTQASLWAYASDVEQPAVIRIPGAPPILIHNPSTLQDNVAHSAKLLTPDEFNAVRRNGSTPLPPHVARWLGPLLPPRAENPAA